MRRREFIAGLSGAAAWPLMARAQTREKVWRVGYLSPVFPPAKSSGDAAVFEAFRGKMSDLGYVEGKNLIINHDTLKGISIVCPVLPTNSSPYRPMRS